jgi:VNT family MFS transporter (synaptic vesicle glycoprotein 2)
VFYQPNCLPTIWDYVEKAQTADFETAIHYSRYGKFQTLLLAVCGTIYATCAISTTTLSFVLPSAECDFNLSSIDKGKLSAMPLIGMIFGCSLWGSIADSKGRKVAIMSSLLVDFLAAFISSFAQSFQLFLICRFFNGFGIIGATSIIFSYLGEFASKKHRDVMLGRLEVFWNIGVIFLPGKC